MDSASARKIDQKQRRPEGLCVSKKNTTYGRDDQMDSASARKIDQKQRRPEGLCVSKKNTTYGRDDQMDSASARKMQHIAETTFWTLRQQEKIDHK
jgi:hypothetical protein